MSKKRLNKKKNEHTMERCCTELIFQINVSSIDDAMNFDELCLAKLECINFESDWPRNSIETFYLVFFV